MGVKHIEAFGDSFLMVQQVSKVCQCHNGSLNAYLNKCLGVLKVMYLLLNHLYQLKVKKIKLTMIKVGFPVLPYFLQNCMTSLSFCYLLDMIAAILLSSYTCYCIAIGSARKAILLELYHFNSIYFVAGAGSDQVSIQISSPWVLLFRYMRCEGLFFRTFTIFLVILYSKDRDERIC